MTLIPEGANRVHVNRFHCCVKFIKNTTTYGKILVAVISPAI